MSAPAPTKQPRGSATLGRPATFGPLVTDKPIIAVAFVVILAAGLLLATMPRLFNQVSDESLQTTLADAPSFARNVEAAMTGLIEADEDDPFIELRELGDRFHEDHMSATLGGLLPESRFVVHSLLFEVDSYRGLPMPGYEVDLRLRYIDGISDHITIDEGRRPEARDPVELWRGSECPPPGDGSPADAITEEQVEEARGEAEFIDCHLRSISVIEAAFSAEHLFRMRLDVGEQMFVYPKQDVIQGSFIQSMGFFVEVVGVLETNDLSDDFWFGDTRLESPAMTLDPELEPEVIHAVGLFAPQAYGEIIERLAPFESWLDTDFDYAFRYFLDPAGVTPPMADEVATELRALQLQRFLAPFDTLRVHTGLPAVIDDYFRMRERTLASLSTSLVGVAASALAVIWLLAALMEHRHRNSSVLVRNRGSSKAQMTLSQIIQGLVVAVPAAALAYLGAVLLVPYQSDLSLMLALGIVVAVPLMFLLAAYRTTHGELGSLQKDDVVGSGPAGRGRVAEILVVVLAAGSLFVVLRRGASGEGVDLLLAMEPALLAIGGGLIAFWLLTLPVGLASWIGSRLSGITAFVGFRRVRQQAPRSRIPMLVIVLTVTIAVFTFAMRASIHQSDVVTSYQTVGADVRVTGSFPGQRLPIDLEAAQAPGVEGSVWGALMQARARMEDRSDSDFLDVLGVDAIEYQRFLAGTDGDPAFPDALLVSEPPANVGNRDNPVPAIVSTGWDTAGPLTQGRAFSMAVGVVSIWFTVEEVRSSFPGLDPNRPFVVADRAMIEAAGARAAMIPTLLYLEAAPDALDGIRESVATWNPDARVDSRVEVHEALAANVMARAVNIGLVVSLFALAGFAILATVGFVILTERARVRDLGLLRTMGLSEPQARGVAVIEVLTTTGVAVLVGALIGVGSVFLLQDAIGLTAFAGAGATTVVVVTVGLTLLALVVVIPLARAGGRRNLTGILKMGDE